MKSSIIPNSSTPPWAIVATAMMLITSTMINVERGQITQKSLKVPLLATNHGRFLCGLFPPHMKMRLLFQIKTLTLIPKAGSFRAQRHHSWWGEEKQEKQYLHVRSMKAVRFSAVMKAIGINILRASRFRKRKNELNRPPRDVSRTWLLKFRAVVAIFMIFIEPMKW